MKFHSSILVGNLYLKLLYPVVWLLKTTFVAESVEIYIPVHNNTGSKGHEIFSVVRNMNSFLCNLQSATANLRYCGESFFYLINWKKLIY